MVVISIRAPLLSFCITVISVVSELLFLSAALTFMRYDVCCRLERNQKVMIRSQHLRVLVVTIFATLAFTTIEAVTSMSSYPAPETQTCLRTILGSKGEENVIEASVINSVCMTIGNGTLSHSEGNFSFPTGSITCTEQPAYSYEIDKKISLGTEGMAIRCQFSTCVFAKLDGETLYFSGPPEENSRESQFLPTQINSDSVKRLTVGLIADSVAGSYASAITEEGEVRRRALMGSINGTCPFVHDRDSRTTIPLVVIISTAIVWASSLLFFVASLFVRRKIFFDITHPMHWAKKVFHDVCRPIGTEPELEIEEIDGKRRIIIVGYTPMKDN